MIVATSVATSAPGPGGPTRGFTLVELMVVVTILGILSSIAIPSFGRYVKKSRTSEATGYLNKMWSGSVGYYEHDHNDSNGVILVKQFPGSGTSAPQEASCCAQASGKCPGSSTIFSNAIWISLNFSIPDAHLYRPVYSSSGLGTGATFTATAHGNLDCDGVQATFSRIGRVNPTTGDVEVSIANFVANEIE